MSAAQDTQDARDGALDAILLVGDWRWRKGPRLPALAAFLLGKRQTVRTHLGDVVRLAWWRGEPYLISYREAADA